jgi:hypothetical protein
MISTQTTPPGLVGCEKVGGGLSARRSNGSMTIFDENGQELIVDDSPAGKRSPPPSGNEAGGSDADVWNPWRQGP